MAYNIPKGTSNQAGFGQPGTAATRQQRNAGRGYNPNMPMGRQLARQAAGGGQPPGRTWSDPGRAYLPPPAPQPSGIDYAGMAAQPNLFNFQDPSVTMGMQALLNEDAGQWAGGAPHIAKLLDQGRLGDYYAPGPMPTPGYDRFTGPQDLPYDPAAEQFALLAGMGLQPASEETFVSQVPETPAGTGYAMLAGMPHEELLEMNRSMGISNISDLSQTQEQLSPFWAPEGLESGDYALTSGGDWEPNTGEKKDGKEWLSAGEKKGVWGDSFWDEKTSQYLNKEQWEYLYGEGSWDESWEENEGDPEKVGYMNKYKKKDPDAVDVEEQEEKDKAIEEKVYEGAILPDEVGADQDAMDENIKSIEAEEQNQMDNLTDMYMNAYQEQSGALNRQFAMMGMIGSSNHMVANNSIMVQMLDQMAKERTQLGMFYDQKIFEIEDFHLEQIEKDLEQFFGHYISLKDQGLKGEALALQMGTSTLNMMISYSDMVGGDFFNMMQSLEDLSDDDKKKWSALVNQEELAFLDCVNGDYTNIPSCGKVYAAAVKGYYKQFAEDEGIELGDDWEESLSSEVGSIEEDEEEKKAELDESGL